MTGVLMCRCVLEMYGEVDKLPLGSLVSPVEIEVGYHRCGRAIGQVFWS